jgi:hypothetical protein
MRFTILLLLDVRQRKRQISFPPTTSEALKVGPCQEGFIGTYFNLVESTNVSRENWIILLRLASGAGQVNVADAIYLVSDCLGNGPGPVDPRKGDLNRDNGADLADVVHLVYYLFQDGPAPCA